MAEFEDKLGAILNNDQAMGQIMALAQSLSGKGETPPPVEMPSTPPEEATEESPLAMLGEIDPRLLQTGLRLLQGYGSGSGQSGALLDALRPFLRADRRDKIDRAVQLARMGGVVRMLLTSMGERGEGDHV